MANGGQGYNGYNPTQNQSEQGSPVGLRNTRYGQIWAGFRKSFALGSQTYLPGPYHYEDQVGAVKGAPYWPAAVYQFRGTFLGMCAGFFDGEGSVIIPCGRRVANGVASSQYWLQVSITQNQRALLLAVQERFGGRVTIMAQPAAKKAKRTIWRWVSDAHVAASFLSAIRPHLRVKGAAADVGIDFQSKMKRNNGSTIGDRAAVLADRANMKARLQRINSEEHALGAGNVAHQGERRLRNIILPNEILTALASQVGDEIA